VSGGERRLGRPGGRDRLWPGVVVAVGVVFGVVALLDAAGGSEEAEGAGKRVLEDAAPGAGRRPSTRGGAAQAEGRGQVLRHIAGVGDGHADRHRRQRRVSPSEKIQSLAAGSHGTRRSIFPAAIGTAPGGGRRKSRGSRVPRVGGR
jgi:hypothetical protein